MPPDKQFSLNSYEMLFCQIVARGAPASFVYEDDWLAAFMTLQPTAPGECLIIPKAHVDHFIDLSDDVAQRIMLVAQHLGRRMRETFSLERRGVFMPGGAASEARMRPRMNAVPHAGSFEERGAPRVCQSD